MKGKCAVCGNPMPAGPWGRDNRGRMCRDCWLDAYPPENPSHCILPERAVEWFGWFIPRMDRYISLPPAEYEIAYLSELDRSLTLWAWSGKFKQLELQPSPFSPAHALDVSRFIMLSDQANINNYVPIMVPLDTVKVCGILYRKDAGPLRVYPEDVIDD